MDVKWFFVIWGFIFVVLIAGAIYFIATMISTQSYVQFQTAQNRTGENFNRSLLIHNALFDNITDLKKGLDPILANIPNATELKIRQDIHYNQTAQDFETIKRLLQIKLQDHELLISLNKSLAVLAGKDTNITNGPNPIVINNGTPVPLLNDTGR
jgi:hypothetical protein